MRRLLPGRCGRDRLRLRGRRDRAALRRTDAGHVAGRRVPRRDDPAGPDPGAERGRGGGAAGQHRHGQRHAGDAGHPSGRRHRRRRARRCTSPASPRRPPGPSADKAVIEGAIMLARTVVALAETPAERDRVLELQAQAGGAMSLAEPPRRWLAAHYDDLVAWRRHIHRHPELGRQEFATTQFVADHLADAGLNPKVLPGGTGLTCDFGPEHGAADRAARRHGRAADGRAHRRALHLGGARTSRTPAATTRTPRCCSARRWRWRRCPSCRSACG